MKVEESLNVTFDESPSPTKLSPLVDDDVGEEEAIKKNTKVVNNNNEEDESIEVDEIFNIKESKISTRSKPKDVKEALKYESWVVAMQEELTQFVANDDWELVPLPIRMVDNTLFTKKSKSHLIIVQIYVDDIIFSSTSQNLCDDFAKIMNDEFEESMMRELNFFLGLQIKQMEDKIFFNQSKYIKEMLKKFGLEDSKPTKMPMSTEIKLTEDDEANFVDSSKYREAVKRIFRYIRGTSHLGLWYPKETGIETIVYAESDHTGDYVDRKSTSGVSEYVSAGKACQQALWMKQALIDYGIRLDDVPIMYDNKGAIDLSKNSVQHSRTKHIEIPHHFLRDNIQKGNISIEKVASEDNIADIFTKPLKGEIFNYLRLGLGMMELIMDSDPSSSQK
ncbi:retrovirus-related pol polyprotein from transposon TNT 1-94 [Tanacetum coccineum]